VAVGQLDGRVAVVTGGGRGIGRGIALRFAREGATVVVSSRTAAEIDKVAAEIAALGGQGVAVVADATDPVSAREPVRQALERFGRIDILVNNVGGVSGRNSTFGGGDESFDATMVLNVQSTWWATTAALPAMREAGYGRVINIGSTEAIRANDHAPVAYVVAKHAVAGMSRQMAADVGDSGITVNCVNPGWTNTSMADFEKIGPYRGMTPEAARAEAAADCSQNLILEPDEIAGMALYLASADGARVTGQILSIDGGYRL